MHTKVGGGGGGVVICSLLQIVLDEATSGAHLLEVLHSDLFASIQLQGSYHKLLLLPL